MLHYFWPCKGPLIFFDEGTSHTFVKSSVENYVLCLVWNPEMVFWTGYALQNTGVHINRLSDTLLPFQNFFTFLTARGQDVLKISDIVMDIGNKRKPERVTCLNSINHIFKRMNEALKLSKDQKFDRNDTSKLDYKSSKTRTVGSFATVSKKVKKMLLLLVFAW